LFGLAICFDCLFLCVSSLMFQFLGEYMPVWRGRMRLSTATLRTFAVLFLAPLLFIGVGAEVRLWAQSPVDGAIAGHVVSGDGTAIAGVEITLHGESGIARTITSSKTGQFLLVGLPPGVYKISRVAPGYRGSVKQQIVVELGRVTEVRLGQVVSRPHGLRPRPGSKPSGSLRKTMYLPAQEATATVVPPGELDALPVEGRDWQTLALSAPGVHADPDADGQSLLSYRGLATTQNSSQIDGVNHDQSFGAVPVGAGANVGREDQDDAEQGGPVVPGGSSGQSIGNGRHAGAAYTFSQSAVREFRLNEQNYSALYGRAAGGVATAVSKSGTNELHGTAFLTIRQSAWGASNPFSVQTMYADGVVASNVVKPHDLRQQFGGSVGGAAVQDKLFYFAAYDQQRRGFPAVSSPGYAGFYTLTATQLALLGNRGVTRAKTNAALNYLSSLTGLVPRRQDQTVVFGKLDWQAGKSNRFSAQYNRARWDSPAGATTAAVVDRGRASLGNNQGNVDEGLIRWTTLIRANLTNEVRLSYGRDFQYETAQTPLAQEPAIGPGGYAPEISIGPQGLLFGTPASLGRKAYPDEHRLQLAETVTWIRGRHLLRVGGEFSAVHDLVDALNNQEGTFSYDSGTTGGHAGGLVDWITDYTFNVNAYPNGGCPSITSKVHDFCFRSFSQSFGQQTTSFDTQEWAGFVQDDWRVRPGLTVNIGARYEYELLPFPQTPNATLDAVFGQTGATSVFPEDRNNIGPRVGVSWQPGWMHGGVLHAGYGIYFGRLPGTTIRSALVDSALPSSTTHVRITPSTETVCPQVANQGFGYACTYLSTPPAAVAATTSAMVFDRRFRLPEVQQGSLSIEHGLGEHGLGAGAVVSATYLMNLDRQLPNSVDINIAPSAGPQLFQLSGGTGAPGVRNGETFAVPVYTSRISSNFGPVTDLISNSNGTYHGAVLELRRSGRTLDLRVSWTWAKAIDEGQSGGVPRTNGQFDPFNVRYDRGLSNLNYPHRIVASAVWEPALRIESRWLRAAANDWQVAPIFSETSGRPYSYNIFGGARLSGGYESINGSGGAAYLPTVGRNTLRLPDTMHVNLRLSRTISLTDRLRLRGIAEVFNLINRVNYSGIQQRAFLVGTAVNGVTPLVFQDAATVASEGLNTLPFGSFTAAGTSEARERQVQLGLRLEF
jgi:Carboxypeptidase regulatory-like domain/TonB dependent receptor